MLILRLSVLLHRTVQQEWLHVITLPHRHRRQHRAESLAMTAAQHTISSVAGRHAGATTTFNRFLDQGGRPIGIAYGGATLECLVATTQQELTVVEGGGIRLI